MIEIADDVDEHENILIGKAVSPQRFEVAGRRVSRLLGQLQREVHDRSLTRRELGPGRVIRHRTRERVVLGSLTEILPVSFRSVVAVIGLRDDRRNHLALRAREARRAVHHFDVELHERAHDVGPQALEPDDLKHFPGAVHGSVILTRKISGRILLRNDVNPSHVVPPYFAAKR